ncbi:MAG: hypothetical protein U1F25_04610 [Rubrivivax sp.]
MEYVAAAGLAHRGGHGQPMALARAVVIAERVAQALAHGHGVVHRDVNHMQCILIDEAAGQVSSATSAWRAWPICNTSRTGVFAGTPGLHVAQRLAEGAQDARADLYSLGVVLFELLGASAARRPRSARCCARWRAGPRAVQQLRPDAPAALRNWWRACSPRTRRPAEAATLAAEALQDVAPRRWRTMSPRRASARSSCATEGRTMTTCAAAAADRSHAASPCAEAGARAFRCTIGSPAATAEPASPLRP